MIDSDLRVTHVLTEGYPMGGAQLDTYYTLRDQRRRHHVELVLGTEGPMADNCRDAGIPTHIISMTNRLMVPLHDLESVLRLRAHFLRTRPDIVHTHSSKAGILGRVAARLAGVPVVIHTVHGPSFHNRQSWLTRWAIIFIERGVARLTDRIITVADTLGAELVRAGVCPLDRIRTVVSGIDVHAFASSGPESRRSIRSELGMAATAPVVVSVSNLMRSKGLDTFVEAAHQVLKFRTDVHFLIVGEGPLESNIRARIAGIGLEGTVILTGARQDIPAILAASDIFVQTSWREGLSRSLVEAMYSGLPIIATNVGATSEVVSDGEAGSGYLVVPGDARALSDRILHLVANPQLREAMGQKGHAVIAGTRTLEAVGIELAKVYEGALGSRRRVDRAAHCHTRGNRDPRRLVYVIDSLVAGGTERHLLRLVQALNATSEWDISVFCLQRHGMFLGAMEATGVQVAGSTRHWRKTPSLILSAITDLYSYLRRERPAIVHCYLPTAGIIGALAARLAGVPIVLTTRRSVHDYRGAAYLRHRLVARAMDRCSDAVIAVSEAARIQAIAEGTPPTKLVTVRNGVMTHQDPRVPARFHGSPVIGAIGALHRDKGFRYLIDAIPLIVRDAPAARFVLVGDGPERASLERRATHLGITDRIDFLGERRDAVALLRDLDIFVLPSVLEGLPNAVLEAMAAGRPIVATSVGGVPEIIQDGVTGLLVAPRSPGRLAQAILRFVADSSLAQRCGAAAAALAESYSVDREIEQTTAVYRRLLGFQTGGADPGSTW